MKRPAFQFYPADWRKDVELRSCSIAARGLWIDVMCIAHECAPYGHLTINGNPMTAAKLAGQVGLTAAQCKALLDELIENGVARVTDEGVIYSKRMVEDEALRNKRAEGGMAGLEHGAKGAEHGKKGGRPRKETGDKKTPLKTPLADVEEPPPSSSSSSSSSSSPSGNSSNGQASYDNPHAPDGHGGTPDGGARHPVPPTGPSMAGAVCVALRSTGMASVNPSHPELLALLKAGAPLDAFVQAASTDKARSARNGFAYVLATVKGQMQDAAAVGSDLARQPRQHVQAQSFRERDRIAGMQRWEQATGQQHPELVALGCSSQPPAGVVIDIETAAKRIAV